MDRAAYDDRVVFETSILKIGAFRCGRDHAAFENSGPIENYCVVFPRTAVAIEHDHEPAFVANPNVVNFYNKGDEYRRSPISDDGDRSDWYALRHDVVVEIAASVDAPAQDRPEQPFARTHAASDASAYALQRQLFTTVTRERVDEPLAVEEAVVGLVTRVLRSAANKPAARDAHAVSRRHVDLVHAAKALLSKEFAAPATLSDVAAALDVSPFHLCRIFHRLCGCTLHEYRQQLRLRWTLEQLAARPRRSVVDLALDAGFSSHSHFGAAFRKAFGQTPSAFLKATLLSRDASESRSKSRTSGRSDSRGFRSRPM